MAVAAHSAAVLPLLLIGTMAVSIRRDLGFDEAAFGAVAACSFAVAAAVSTPAGRVVERRGAAWGVRAGALTAAVSLIGVAGLARSWSTLLVFAMLGGAAMAVAQPATDLWLTRTLPVTRHGLAFGVKQASAGPGVGLAAGLAVPAAAATVGWRGAFALAALVGLGVLWATRRQEPVLGTATSAIRGDGAEKREGSRAGDVSMGPLLLLTMAGGFGSMSQAAFLTFAVSSAVEAGVSEGGAGLLFAASSAAAFAMRLALGAFADRRQGGLVFTTAAMMLTSAAGFALLATGSRGAVLAAVPFVAATAWGWQGIFFLVVARCNPNAPAAASGLTASGLLAGSVVGPVVFGIAARDDYATAWMLAAASALLGAAAMVVGRHFIKRDLDAHRGAVTAPSTAAAASPGTREDLPPGRQ